MKLEVGKTYKARNGEKVKIDQRYVSGPYHYRSGPTRFYAEDGTWLLGELSPFDLIEEWQDEFPVLKLSKDTNADQFKTLRDDFAMAALTGLLANPVLLEAMSKEGVHGANGSIVRAALKHADAMMKQRKKEGV